MTPFVPAADVAQVEILYELFGQIVENRLWFKDRQPPITSAQLQDLANGVAGWHVAELLPLLSEHLVLAAVVATDWTTPAKPFEVAVLTPQIGGILGECLSANVAIRVRFKLDSSAAYYNANFLPGIPHDKVNTNTFDPVWAAAIREAYIVLIDAAGQFGPFPAWEWSGCSAWLDGSLRSEQQVARVDHIRFPSPYVSPRRKRLPPAP